MRFSGVVRYSYVTLECWSNTQVVATKRIFSGSSWSQVSTTTLYLSLSMP
jgi:hypothetical protein